MQLTPHFHLSEFTYSETAKRLGIDNTPPPEIVWRIAQTAFALETLRAAVYRKSVIVMSGWRSAAVNTAVGGTDTSDHMTGWAADYRVAGTTAMPAAKAARDFLLSSRMPFDQLIYEPRRGIVHLSIAPQYRCQIRTQRGGPGSPLEIGIPE
ncbi:MAG TPA: D-Ala-D-Ala carboxypeptidase family metallohydrolase [Hyphomicrobium sp.]|nr:D-Ala-D-Ala carboxypeptidase family metallohydrolase [Hyphomicrobium sp.]